MFSSKGIQYLLFILSLLLICSCSESTEPDNSIPELIPLKIGNTWNYSRTVYDSSGFVHYTDNIISSVQRDTIIILSGMDILMHQGVFISLINPPDTGDFKR
jgi:hypothetical protein